MGVGQCYGIAALSPQQLLYFHCKCIIDIITIYDPLPHIKSSGGIRVYKNTTSLRSLIVRIIKPFDLKTLCQISYHMHIWAKTDHKSKCFFLIWYRALSSISWNNFIYPWSIATEHDSDETIPNPNIFSKKWLFGMSPSNQSYAWLFLDLPYMPWLNSLTLRVLYDESRLLPLYY